MILHEAITSNVKAQIDLFSSITSSHLQVKEGKKVRVINN